LIGAVRDKVIFWGLCLTLVLLPLPFGGVEEWAIFAFEVATFLLFAVHLIGQGSSEAANRSNLNQAVSTGGQSSTSREFRIPLWLKIAGVVAFFIAVLQLIPLPPSLVGIISPQTWAIRSRLSSAELGGAAGGGWAPLSLVPNSTLYELVGYVFYFLFGYLIYKHVRERKQVEIFVLLMLACASFQALYGLVELFGGTEKILGFKKVDYLGSATGTFINRNHFSGFLEMIFPLSLGYLLAKANFFAMKKGVAFKDKILWFSQERLQKSVLFGLVSVLIGVGIIFSRSRTGIFIFLAGIFLMIIVLSGAGGRSEERVGAGRGGRRSVKVIRTVFFVVFFAAALIGIKPVIERFSLTDLARETRPIIYKNTAELIKNFPLFGTGLGTYLYAYPLFERKPVAGLMDHAHNDYLELLAEAGIIGGGALILFAFGLVIHLFLKWGQRRDSFIRGVGLGCLVGIAAILVHSLTDFNLRITANAVYFVTLFALGMRVVGLSSLGRNRAEARTEEIEGGSR
jgi:O-antigen ligase